ncbi:MAG: D-alanyl-lipoteichoic acid biosynthesis protein DltB [Bacillota bacterium]|nr:D-alanyl-lipoteichoic acid biosynthesis protein DltB [Bacillota bacterium]
MQILSDFYFFVLAAAAVIPALVLGAKEKSLKYYTFAVTVMFLGLAMKSAPETAVFMAGYCAYQYILIRAFLRITKIKGRRKGVYRICILLSLLPLILNKVFAAFEISVPGFIGISYMSFKSVQMLIEIYDGIIGKTDFFEFLNFLIFFPTVVSGPIDRSRRFGDDFNRILPRKEYLDLAGRGLFKICLGILYKFTLGAAAYQAVVWTGKEDALIWNVLYMYSYGVYLFFDFAGYSLMAAGLGYIFGIEVPDNFNKPFISRDIKEFWDRWHISLSHWFRDFVFTRFMMNAIRNKWFDSRLSAAACGFIINMGLMGVWHGIDISYIIYGLYHGTILALTEVYQKKSMFYKKHKKEKLYIAASWFVTFNLVMFGFFIFSGRFIRLIGLN